MSLAENIPFVCPSCGRLDHIKVQWITTQTITTDPLSRVVTVNEPGPTTCTAQCPCGEQWTVSGSA